MLGIIWQSSNGSEWMFLLAAIVFFLATLVALIYRRPLVEGATAPRVSYGWLFDILLGIGLVLASLGLLAL